MHKKIREILRFGLWIGAFVLVLNWQSLAERLRGPVDYQAALAGKVTLYSTSWCGYCRRTRQFLNAHDIPFAERDIEESEAAYDAYQRVGGQGVPVVTVGRQVVHGYRPGRLREVLECADC